MRTLTSMCHFACVHASGLRVWQANVYHVVACHTVQMNPSLDPFFFIAFICCSGYDLTALWSLAFPVTLLSTKVLDGTTS